MLQDLQKTTNKRVPKSNFRCILADSCKVDWDLSFANLMAVLRAQPPIRLLMMFLKKNVILGGISHVATPKS